MEKKDRNVMPGDSEIVTKKGFLITPPPQKRTRKPLAAILNGEAGYKGDGENRSEKKDRPAQGGQENGGEPRRNNKERGERPAGNRPQKNRPPRPDRDRNGANGNAKNAGNETSRNNVARNDVARNGANGTVANNAGAQNPNGNNPNGNIKNDERRRPRNNRPQKNNRPQGERNQNERFSSAGENGAPRGDRPQNGKNSRRPEKTRTNENRPQNAPQNQAAPQKDGKNRPDNAKQGGKGARGGIKPQKKLSVLADLGFNSETFFGHSNEPEQKPEIEEKIDYSKAVPLRDQIYPPKKETTEEPENDEGKSEIIGVRFKEAGKIYYFDPDGKIIPYGTPVIVETARGQEYGYTAVSNRKIPSDSIVSPLKKIIRPATPDDTERLLANREQEKTAAGVFIEKAKKCKLDMHLVGVEYTFDNTKLLFYFTAEGRVDFRELVKELASVFRTRIELRQVGVRDEAKLLGGLGVCGRPLCCKTFLGEFAQVSIKMAKDQNLSLNSSKISGTCGRLLCCLRYEDEVYQKEYERTPKVDAIVETKEGKGVVTETNPLKGIVKVRLNDKPDTPPQSFPRDEVTVVGYAKSSKNIQEEAALKSLENE